VCWYIKDSQLIKWNFLVNIKGIMENFKNKESYLQRKAKQLQQWERVIDKLISRVEQTKDRKKTELRHHIVKIQVKKARTAVKLRQLQNTGNGKWNEIKADFEKSWRELRQAFLKASAKPK
jgi:hypothetical protein